MSGLTDSTLGRRETVGWPAASGHVTERLWESVREKSAPVLSTHLKDSLHFVFGNNRMNVQSLSTKRKIHFMRTFVFHVTGAETVAEKPS